MKIKVKAFATFREVMDIETDLDIGEGATVQILLTELTGRYKDLYEQMFAAPEILRDLVNVLKNGRNINFLAGLDTPLNDGDVIALFPPAGG